MTLFGGVISVTGIGFLLLCVFGILFAGYALGRITVKGVSLGDAGVFIIALLFGAIFCVSSGGQIDIRVGETVLGSYSTNLIKIVESLGLILFVTSVGFIAGPKFFGNLKKNFKSYVLLGLVIILAGGAAAAGCIFFGQAFGFGSGAENLDEFVAMIVGLLSGSLTSTPAFGAAKTTVIGTAATPEIAEKLEELVTVGHGISYIFGVVGVVLFVQLIPKLSKADMDAERAKLSASGDAPVKQLPAGLLQLDSHGFAPFALAAVLGTIVGQIKIPLSSAGLGGTCFSLTTTGGCLLVSLVLGHFARIGKLSITPDKHTLQLLRELGLVLFLVGAGIPGGAGFVAAFDPMYFVYGIIMTIVPMIVGFIFAKYVLKLPLLNNLGSLTGGMTSTPALGTLIGVAKTEDVAAAYAATYPIALIAVVLVSQFLILLF